MHYNEQIVSFDLVRARRRKEESKCYRVIQQRIQISLVGA